jgi:hypothetical protein
LGTSPEPAYFKILHFFYINVKPNISKFKIRLLKNLSNMAEENLNEESNNDFGQVFFNWEIPEFIEYPRSPLWYLAVIIIGLILIIYSIWTANFLFALIVILAAFIVFLRSYRKAANLIFQITEDGLMIGNQFFKYDQIKSFYIVYDPPAVKKLFFNPKGLYPTISVPLHDKNPLLIRQKLLEYIKEDLDKKNQSIDDQLETIFKL